MCGLECSSWSGYLPIRGRRAPRIPRNRARLAAGRRAAKRLAGNLKLSLPATMAFDYPTVSSLAENLLSLLGFASAAAMTAPHPNSVDPTADAVSIDDLSVVEAEALLEGRTRSSPRNSRRAKTDMASPHNQLSAVKRALVELPRCAHNSTPRRRAPGSRLHHRK